MPSPDRGSASYRAVLALPHARNLFAAAMLARLCYGLLGLPLLLTLREGTGSYAVAGTATGLFGLIAAFLGPVRARWVERHRATLMLLAVCYALLVCTLAAACAVRVPTPLAVCLTVLAGLFPPPVGPLMRTAWSRLAADEAQRQCALSLDTAAESTVFALGPVLGGFLIALASAPAVLVLCAVLVITGFGWLATALRRSSVTGDAASPAAGHPQSPLRAGQFPPLLLLALSTAAAFSLVEIAIVAAWGSVTAGVLTTLFSVGGVLGGLTYGGRRWRGALWRRPLLMEVAVALFYTLPVLVYAAAAAGAALLFAGACTDVLLIAAYQLVDRYVPEGSRTEAGAWINTAYNLGGSLGTAVGGVLVGRSGPPAAFAVTAGLLGVCLLIGVPWTLRQRATKAEGNPAPSRPEPTAAGTAATAARSSSHPASTEHNSPR
ncbi:MFS transporter [Streptomyces sp. NPDC090442]|uniref:MFS transporter n=1 Tax=Streptomyces sp. NPDC090442 TaxID=3365962 RepID=UPI003829BFB5